MFKIAEVKPQARYRLWIRFTDGTAGNVDLSHLAGKGVFAIWDEPGGFESVMLGPSGELRWSDYVDLCPDAIYLRVTGKSPAEVFPNLAQAAPHARA
jgi:hypothetical protein